MLLQHNNSKFFFRIWRTYTSTFKKQIITKISQGNREKTVTHTPWSGLPSTKQNSIFPYEKVTELDAKNLLYIGIYNIANI